MVKGYTELATSVRFSYCRAWGKEMVLIPPRCQSAIDFRLTTTVMLTVPDAGRS